MSTGPILDAKVEGNSVRLLAEGGREKLVAFPTRVLNAFVHDLDGDGRNECFVASSHRDVDPGKLYLLDESGRQVRDGWPYVFDLPNPYPGQDRTDRFAAFAATTLTWQGKRHVATVFNEATYWRSALVLLDAGGVTASPC